MGDPNTDFPQPDESEVAPTAPVQAVMPDTAGDSRERVVSDLIADLEGKGFPQQVLGKIGQIMGRRVQPYPTTPEAAEVSEPRGPVEIMAGIKKEKWARTTDTELPPTEDELAARPAVEEGRRALEADVRDWIATHQANLRPINASPGMTGWNERVGLFDAVGIDGKPMRMSVYTFDGDTTIFGDHPVGNPTPDETTIRIAELHNSSDDYWLGQAPGLDRRQDRGDWGSMKIYPDGDIHVKHSHNKVTRFKDESGHVSAGWGEWLYSTRTVEEDDFIRKGGDVQRFKDPFFQETHPDGLKRGQALFERLEAATPQTVGPESTVAASSTPLAPAV